MKSPRRVWLTGFLAFFALSAAWALATPLTAAPDEPAHIVKAAATARGELSGVASLNVVKINGIVTHQQLTGFRLPAQYAHLSDMHTCYTYLPHVTAACAVPMPDGQAEALVQTSAGGSNPLYYAAVGWPSLIDTGQGGVYAMRLVSAAICAAFLACALALASQWSRRRGWLMLGIAASATPTTLFLSGTVNPNSVEVCGAILLWTAMLGLFVDPQPALVARRLAAAGTASVALANVRPLGPLWIVGVLLCALLVSRPGTLRGLLRLPGLWLWTGVVAAGTLAAFAWSVHSKALTTAAVDRPDLTFGKAAAYTFHHTWYYIESMIGNFGWLDVRAPAGTVYGWYAVVAVLGILALRFGNPRERVALVGIAVAIVVVPMVAQGKQAASLGYIWQGRYLLAVAVGLPLLSAAVLANRPEGRRPAVRGVVPAAAVIAAAAGFLAFYSTLRRYSVGSTGPLISLHHVWTPPGGFYPIVVLYLLGAAVLGTAIAGTRRDASEVSRPAAGDRVAAHSDAEGHIPEPVLSAATADGGLTSTPEPVG